MTKYTPYLFVMVFGLMALPAAAQDTIHMLYIVTPTEGESMEFEDAMRRHIQWRTQQNDPWTWTVFQLNIGADLPQYIIRTANHTWADFDAYGAFQQKAVDHFRSNVAKYVKSIGNQIEVPLPDITREWTLDEPAPVIAMTVYHLTSTGEPAFMEAVGKVHAAIVEHDYPVYYEFLQNAVGVDAGTIRIVSGHPNFAGLKAPDQQLGAFLTEAVGGEEAQKIFEMFGSSVEHTESTVWVRRPDLSSPR